MKKIVCLIESLGSGGAERQMAYLASALKAEGHSVELWTYYPNDFYKYILDESGVRYRCIHEAQSKWKRIYVLRKELKRSRPDAVITYLDTASIVGCMIKLLGGKFKLIVSDRNTTQKITLRERVRFFMFRFADWIVPNSHTQTKFIKANFPNLSQKIKTITNFVDSDYFTPKAAEKFLQNCTKLLVVGRVMPQKNVLRFIEAIRLVKDKGADIHVDWYGGKVNNDYYEQCIQAIEKHHLQNIFQFHPATKNIIDEYHKADVFCLPSIFEGFPNVLCEAMSCGLPVLCSNVCDNPDIAEDGINGLLFNPQNPEEIASKILSFVNVNQEQKNTMGEKSREIIIKKYSKKSFIDSYNLLIG